MQRISHWIDGKAFGGVGDGCANRKLGPQVVDEPFHLGRRHDRPALVALGEQFRMRAV